MMKFIKALAFLLFSVPSMAGPYYGNKLSTATGKATQNLSGIFTIAVDSTTSGVATITLDGTDGSHTTLPMTLVGSSMTITGNAFSVGGSTFVVFGGNIGVGTTTPNTPIHVANSAASGTTIIKVDNPSSGAGATKAFYLQEGSTLQGLFLAASSGASDPHAVELRSHQNAPIMFVTNAIGGGLSKLTIDADGQLRILPDSVNGSTFTVSGDLQLANDLILGGLVDGFDFSVFVLDTNSSTDTLRSDVDSNDVELATLATTYVNVIGDTMTGDLDVSGLRVSFASSTINGVAYNFTESQGAIDQFLRNDGSGNLSWTTPSGAGDALLAATQTWTGINENMYVFVGSQTFTASGAATYTKTSNVNRIHIRMVGGGGGGGQGFSGGNGGTGGGAGGYCEHWAVVTDTATLALTVGVGGAGGSSDCANGSAGGATVITELSLSVGGGGGGQCTASATDAGGAPGLASGGATACHFSAKGEGGDHIFIVVNFGTHGGSSFFGGAGVGSFAGGIGTGTSGGGGGGGRSTASTSGAGGAGVIIIEEYY